MGYVDKDFLVRSLERKREYILEHFPEEIASFDSALEFVRAVPPDKYARTVIHAKWREGVYAGYRCPVCTTTWDSPTNFCPNCGSDMR